MSLRIVPREYQVWVLNKLLKWFENNRTGNPLILLPTGTGNSVVIAMLMDWIFRYFPRQKVLVLAHVQELVQQNYSELMDLWPTAPAGVYAAGLGARDTHQRIIFAMMQSIAGKVGALFGHVDLVVIDEAHMVSPAETTRYQEIIHQLMLINPKLRVIGLTATGYRLGHGLLTDNHIFTDVAFDGCSYEAFNWFIDNGYLSRLVSGKTSTKFDLDGVHKRGGEFIEAELQTAVDKMEITEPICREIAEWGVRQERRSWLIFATGVDHAEHIKEVMNYLGIETEAVHSKMKGDRKKILERFKHYDLRCVVNNNVLTTGFNHKGVDLIAMMRATESTSLHVQMCGRGTRTLFAEGFDTNVAEGRLAAIAASPKPDCLFLDFAGNTKRLGAINDPVIPRKKGKGTGPAPVKECPSCGEAIHASIRICNVLTPNGKILLENGDRQCGYEFPVQSKLQFKPSNEDILKNDQPIVEIFKVNHVTYSKHSKNNIDMVKAVYYCGHKSFSEYIGLEHPDLPDGRENFAKRKARQWWKLRCGNEPMPEKCQELMDMANLIPPATHLRVWINKQYPEIMGTDITGTAFGTQAADNDKPEVDVAEVAGHVSFHFLNNEKKKKEAQVTPDGFDEMDDDIPF